MKILIVSQYFWPENFRINDLSSELSKRGHKVTILTGKPNYPEGRFNYEFVKSPSSYSEYNGCTIIRVPIYPRGKGNSFNLILNYCSYFLSAIFIGFWRLRKSDFDVIFVFQPSPVTVGIPGVFFKKIKKTPLIFWTLDLWPNSLEAIGAVKSKTILSIVGKLVSFIYNRCDLVLGQSKAFIPEISNYIKNKNKIKYFPSWSENIFQNPSYIKDTVIQDYKNSFNILFAGNIGQAQDFPSIINAAEVLKKKDKNFKFFIIGDGRALGWVRQEIISRKLEKMVLLLGKFDLEDMPSFYSDSDALLVSLKDSDIFKKTIPGKIQSYMAAQKPILSMVTGEGSRIILEADCGYVAKSGDYKTLANNIIAMSNLGKQDLLNLGKNAGNYYKKEFERDNLITQLENWFLELK